MKSREPEQSTLPLSPPGPPSAEERLAWLERRHAAVIFLSVDHHTSSNVKPWRVRAPGKFHGAGATLTEAIDNAMKPRGE